MNLVGAEACPPIVLQTPGAAPAALRESACRSAQAAGGTDPAADSDYTSGVSTSSFDSEAMAAAPAAARPTTAPDSAASALPHAQRRRRRLAPP